MEATWFVLAVFVALALGSSSLVLLRRRDKSHFGDEDWNWAESFSAIKYRPMERLLCPEDESFLRSQPGYDRSLERTLRKGRRRVFRSYLSAIRRDFDRLYTLAKQAVLYSEADESALLQVLLRQRLVFYWALCVVECRLAAYSFGVGTVDVTPLVNAVQAMREALRVLEPIPEPA